MSLDYRDSARLLIRLSIDPAHHLIADNKRFCWTLQDQNGDRIWDFRPPLTFPPIMSGSGLETYQQNIPALPGNFLVLLIQAGNAALGAFSGSDTLIDKKIIRAYMVRKKQGKAQLKHLSSKGKSRAGSRIRLAQTEKFLTEISAWTAKIVKELEVEHVFYSCQPQLWGMLFQKKHRLPFDKKDLRIRKIPLDVNIPNSEELTRVLARLQFGRLSLFRDSADFTVR